MFRQRLQWFKRVFWLLPQKLKFRFVKIVAIALVVSIFDSLGVASIFPIIQILGQPDAIREVSGYFSDLGIVIEDRTLASSLLILCFTCFLIAILLRALNFLHQNKFALSVERYFSEALIKNYLGRPYEFYMTRDAAELTKNALSESSVIAFNGVLPLASFLSGVFLLICVGSVLLIIDFMVFLVVFGVLAISFICFLQVLTPFLNRESRRRFKSNEIRFRLATEMFSGVKEIKIFGFEKSFGTEFSMAASQFSSSQFVLNIMGQMPRYALEFLIYFATMVFVITYFDQQQLFTYIPLMSVYAAALYRMVPAMQQVYLSLTKTNTLAPALERVEQDLSSVVASNCEQIDWSGCGGIKKLSGITFDGVDYLYPGSEKLVLRKVSFQLPGVGLILFNGLNGSGKSTVLNLLAGLTAPSLGKVRYHFQSGLSIEANNLLGSGVIGYVPQDVYLASRSIAENIAFGFEPDAIDSAKVLMAAKLAGAHHFISDRCQDGYTTVLRDRGASLSGGQRQRIAIARALYSNSSVLILDEATSALDSVSQNQIFETVTALKKQLLVLIVEHKGLWRSEADLIFNVQDGDVRQE